MSGSLDLTQSFMKVPKAIWRGASGGEGGSGTGAPWSSQGHSMQTQLSLLPSWGRSGGREQQLSAPEGPQSGQLSPHPQAHRGGLEKQGGWQQGHLPGGLHILIWLWPWSREVGEVAPSFSQEVVLGVRSGAGEAGEHWAWQRSWVREGGMPW